MEPLTLRGRNPLLLQDLLRDAPETVGLRADLHLPKDRSGPHPGLVVLDGLGGPKEAREHAYGHALSDEGYAVLVLDSFASRGVGARGDLVRALKVSEAMMLTDAFTAVDWLAARPDVDAKRIGVVGFSYGGMIAVLAAYRQLADLILPGGPRFATHISYYGCSIPRMEDPTTTGAPVALLLGALDRNVSIPRSEAIADDLRRGGSKVAMEVFEDVYHQWDGSDEKKRFFPFNLRRLRFAIGRDQRARDERTGLAMTGRASRTGLIALWTDPTGYSMLRDREATRRSDAILRDALEAM